MYQKREKDRLSPTSDSARAQEGPVRILEAIKHLYEFTH